MCCRSIDAATTDALSGASLCGEADFESSDTKKKTEDAPLCWYQQSRELRSRLLRKGTGWTKSKSGRILTIHVATTAVYAGAPGHLFCLELRLRKRSPAESSPRSWAQLGAIWARRSESRPFAAQKVGHLRV